MQRLTKKTMFGDYTVDVTEPEEIEKAKNVAINTLGKVEDYIENYGVNPFVLLEGLKNGIYYKTRDGEIKMGCKCYLGWTADCDGEWLCNFRNLIVVPNYGGLELKHYGTRWALTEKELEENKNGK